MKPYTMAGPQALPAPKDLVVKKVLKQARQEFGSDAGAGVGDVELHVVAGHFHQQGQAGETWRVAVAMVRVPPSGMASRALMARLSSAFRAGGGPPGRGAYRWAVRA